jgi:hypothetical protein
MHLGVVWVYRGQRENLHLLLVVVVVVVVVGNQYLSIGLRRGPPNLVAGFVFGSGLGM